MPGGHSLADLPIFIVFCFFITSCTPVLYSYNSKICFVCFYRVWAACFDHRCGVGRVRWTSPDWLPGDRDGLRKEREGRRLLEVRQTGEHHAKNGLLCMFFLFFIPISSIQNDFSTRGKKIKFETTALFACLAWMLSALCWPFGSMSWKKKVVFAICLDCKIHCKMPVSQIDDGHLHVRYSLKSQSFCIFRNITLLTHEKKKIH